MLQQLSREDTYYTCFRHYDRSNRSGSLRQIARLHVVPGWAPGGCLPHHVDASDQQGITTQVAEDLRSTDLELVCV